MRMWNATGGPLVRMATSIVPSQSSDKNAPTPPQGPEL